MHTTIETIRFEEQVPYDEAYKKQIERRDAVELNESENALLLLEHTPTFTLGRKAHEEHILQSRDALKKIGIEVCEVDRGGDVTYHGPGQLVGYPILNLESWQKSVSWYLRSLEEVIIQTLAHYEISGERMEKFTGVWVDGAKVAAVGIGIHKWTTYHGISINLNPDPDHWRLIIPCGIPDKPVTSLHQLMNEPPTMEGLMNTFEEQFRKQFGA